VGVVEIRGGERSEFEARFRCRNRRLQDPADGAALGVFGVGVMMDLDGAPHEEHDEEHDE
jgi:hypothetical protein